jgi:hypothetical protein
MKLKLKGKQQFEAFLTILRLIIIRTPTFLSVRDYCNSLAINKLMFKLMQTLMTQREWKTISIKLSETQTATVFDELQTLALPAYEHTIAIEIIAQIERWFYNQRGAAAGTKLNDLKPLSLNSLNSLKSLNTTFNA